MNNLNIPGFTAAASIYTKSGRYQTIDGGKSELMSAVVPHLPIGGGGGVIGGGGVVAGPSCSFRCNNERNDCVSSCDNYDDAGYTCYFGCWSAYYACMAGCITGGGGATGGGGVIAA